MTSKAMEVSRPRLTARAAVSLIFVIHGVLVATWACYIPSIKERLQLSDGTLGLILFGMGMGCFLSLFLTPGLIHRFGSRSVTLISTLGLCLSIPLSITSHSLGSLATLLICNGLLIGMMDMGMNAQAGEIEEQMGRPIMSGVHALFSLGSLSAAFLGSLALGGGIPPVLHLATLALISGYVGASVRHGLVPKRREHPHEIPWIKIPEKRFWGLGLLCFIAFMSEGAVIDWTPLFLEYHQGASKGTALLGIAAFQIGMTGGRFTGDHLRIRFGTTHLFIASSILAALGLALALAQGSAAISLLGLIAVGLGLANTVPLLFSTASKLSGQGNEGTGIAGVAGVGYCGILIGPPAIGFVSEAVGLRGALGILTLLLTVLVFRGNSVGNKG